MFVQCFYAAVVLFVYVHTATVPELSKDITSSPLHEESENPIVMEGAGACLAQGGVCTLVAACPEGAVLQEKGLCGRSNLACCQQLPITARKCSQRGGQCVSAERCHKGPRDPRGACPDKQVCCIWV